MILPVYVYGWPLLRKKSEEITPDYPNLKQLIADMFDTMYKADGVGLAAPQIGLSIRLIVIDGAAYAKDDAPDDEPLRTFKKVLVNPVITARGGDEWADNEGCLSLPKIRESVKRPYWIDLSYCDESFNSFSERFEGIQARIIQHEYDHIEGALFIDKISPIRRKLITGKLTAIIKGKADCSYKIKTFKK